MSTATTRPPVPFNAEAEEAVVASLLVAKTALARVRPILAPGDFLDQPCRAIFAACIRVGEGGDLNQISVAHDLLQQNGHAAPPEGGWPFFLSRIVGELPTPIGVEGYAKIVHDDAIYRQLIGASGQIAEMASQGGPELAEIVKRARDLIDSIAEPTQAGASIRFEAQTVGAFMEEEIPAVDAIITDGGQGAIASPSEKIMLGGPPGVGKTNLAMNMGAGLAAGTGFLGLPCGRRWNTLYVPPEGNRKRLQKRFRKVLAGTDAETKSRFHFAHLPALDLSNDAHVQALEELCRRHSTDVLILDPLRDIHPWGEDKSEDAARVMRVLDGLLAALPGLAIVLVHHVRKPDTRRLTRAEQTLDQIRGSGHLVAACQSVLLVNEDPTEPDKLLADWVKTRDAEERLAPMFLYFDRATLTYEVAERPSTVKVSPEAIVNAIVSAGGYHEGPTLVRGMMEGSGASERTVRDAIRQARDLGLITEENVPGSGNTRAYRVELEEGEAR